MSKCVSPSEAFFVGDQSALVDFDAKVAGRWVRNYCARVVMGTEALKNEFVEAELLRPGTSTIPFTGEPTAIRPTAVATSSAAMGWMSTGASRTVEPSLEASAILLKNSKNWVAWTIENGIEDSVISFSCVIFARKYPRIVFSASNGLL